MANRLAGETSPYLLQHASNPVDWYPWGEEALERARELDRPILLSVGYAACHWCHVMAHESFEDEAIARFMNEHFVNVKVDREERPDLDRIYQSVCQLVTGQGGWPLTVILTPEARPFYVGTYFPPEPRWGRPGLFQVLAAVSEAWTFRRDEVEQVARSFASAFAEAQALPPSPGALPDSPLARAAKALAREFDTRRGGFGGAPKFPNPVRLTLFLRAHEAGAGTEYLAMAERALTAMAQGGIHDQLGGGFHRYSVDADWRVPHFEKMLSDNALLAGLYAEAFLLTGQDRYRAVAETTLAYLDRELALACGGLASSQDADSEGEEGRYYTFTRSEVLAAVGEDGDLLCRALGVDPGVPGPGGRSVLFEAADPWQLAEELGEDPSEVGARIEAGRARLFRARAERVAPARDGKVVAAWNALAVSARVQGARALGSPALERSARELMDFLLAHHVDGDGRVWRLGRAGRTRVPGFLDDHAFVAAALADLYTLTLEPRYLTRALEVARTILARFTDPAGGPPFMTDGSQPLLERPRDLVDEATPSGTGVALETLLRLDPLTSADLAGPAVAVLERLQPLMDASPFMTASIILAADRARRGNVEVTLRARSGDPTLGHWHRRLVARHLPRLVLHAPGAPEDAPMAARPAAPAGEAAAWVCAHGTCSPPLSRWVDIEARLADASTRSAGGVMADVE